MATQSSSKSLPSMSSSERLAFYRAAARSSSPADEGQRSSIAEVVGKLGADGRSFFTNVSATYKFHRQENLR